MQVWNLLEDHLIWLRGQLSLLTCCMGAPNIYTMLLNCFIYKGLHLQVNLVPHFSGTMLLGNTY